ncbi:MAG: MFS transporter [Gammaproteobacteria bacterium]|nr:MFS transporter [Gammaproteobacteria bacterium]
MRRVFFMFALIMAGEMIFGLPFHTARFFRPTMLEVFGFSNTVLGDLFAVYGITAMIAYFPGGALADRFPARNLLAASLLATSLGGLYMLTIPNALQMAMLYGYFGITSIFLLWGALIRATREWGGHDTQGEAFGLLEAGRGLAAASVGMLAIAAFASYLPPDPSAASDAERLLGFRSLVALYTAITAATAVLVWFAVPVIDIETDQRPSPWANMLTVMRKRIVWAQAGIIVFAYCGFKGLDNYSLYAVQVLGMNEVDGARLATYGTYLRPLAALAAGLVADRFSANRTILVLFAAAAVAFGVLSQVSPERGGLVIIYANIIVSLFAVFALRGIYFALLEETAIPKQMTGAAVGLISLVGFTPEIFFAPIAGRILDAAPGAAGHLNYFLFLAVLSAAGVAVAFWLSRMRGNKRAADPVS